MTSVLSPRSAALASAFHYAPHSEVHCSGCNKACAPFITAKSDHGSKQPVAYCSISCYRRNRDAKLFEQARKELLAEDV